jgi:two-component system NtrC family sensor kinase
LFLTVGITLTVHAMISFRSTKEHFLRLVEADIDHYGRLIKRATHDGMLLNLKEEVQATIERLGEGPELSTIRVYDLQGTTMMSAQENEIGDRIALESETCSSCHCAGGASATTALERRSLARVANGVEVLRHLSVIENEPSCSTAACHAHPPDQGVLGILEVEMSMEPLESTLQTSRRQFLWTTLILIGVVGVVVAVFIRRLVHYPVMQLYEGTLRIAGGDLDTRIEPHGRHELARLAVAFNQMADDLSAARQEITQWSQQLEEKVVEKTEELSRAQRQVLHMEKMSSLGKLSATVAHELNNPISGMLTYAKLVRRELRNQPLEEDVREELNRYLGLMEKECSRCGGIVQNLLLFARHKGAAMVAVDLNAVVDQALMLVRHHLTISGITLHSELLEGDSEIVADAGQLQQALVALFVNAVEAMAGQEDGELTVRLRGTPDEVWIDVGDTGVGIPPEVLPQIFEPFFSTKEKESGVGLGLAVVYGIVERHGGRIEVESKVGQYTIFHLRLPRRAAAPDEGPTTDSSRGVPI